MPLNRVGQLAAKFEQIAAEHVQKQGSLQGKTIKAGGKDDLSGLGPANLKREAPEAKAPTFKGVSPFSNKASHATQETAAKTFKEELHFDFKLDLKAKESLQDESREFKLNLKPEEESRNEQTTFKMGLKLEEDAPHIVTIDKIEEFISDKGISREMIAKEAELLDVTPREAAKQMKVRFEKLERAGLDPTATMGSIGERMKITGYSKALVMAVEDNISPLSADGKEVPKNEKVDGFVINRFVHEGKPLVIIHEAVISAGTFKEARAASDFFKLENPSERRTLADVRPKESHTLTPDAKMKDFATKEKTFETVTEDQLIFSTVLKEDHDVAPGAGQEGDEVIAYQTVEGTSIFKEEEVKEDLGTIIEKKRLESFYGSFVMNDDTLKTNKFEVPDFKNIAFKDGPIKGGATIEEKSEAEIYLDEIKYEAAFVGQSGFLQSMMVLDANTEAPVTIKPVAGFTLPGLKNSNGEIIREETNCFDLNLYLETINETMTQKDCEIALNIFEGAAQAVATFHAAGHVNNDVKPANFLLSPDGEAIFTDFGTVTVASKEENAKKQGTPVFMSPEASKGVHDFGCDVWSFGITLQTLLVATRGADDHPSLTAMGSSFDTNPMRHFPQLEKLYSNTEVKARYNENYPEPNRATEPFKHLCWATTRANPEERLTMQQVKDFISLNKSAMMAEIASYGR